MGFIPTFFHVGNPIRDIGLEAVRQKLGSIKAFEKFSIHILRGVKAKDLTKIQVIIWFIFVFEILL